MLVNPGTQQRALPSGIEPPEGMGQDASETCPGEIRQHQQSRDPVGAEAYSGRIMLGGTGICILGAVDHYLGALALARGDVATARADLAAAAALERACGLTAFVGRTEAVSAQVE